jgi:hypothetical protein
MRHHPALRLLSLGLVAALMLLYGNMGCASHRKQAVPAAFNFPEQGLTIEAPPQSIQSGVSGRIFDLAQKPVEGALVEVFDPSTSIRIAVQFSTKLGGFAFRRLPKGRLDLRITKPAFSRYMTPLDVHDGNAVTQLVIELRPAI